MIFTDVKLSIWIFVVFGVSRFKSIIYNTYLVKIITEATD